MKIFESTDEFNQATGAGVTADDQPQDGFTEESWNGHRLRGQGLPGGDPGWHLVYHHGTEAEHGWLIGYEYASDAKTGRVLLVREKWTAEKDRDACKIAGANFEKLFRYKVGMGEANVDYLDRIMG